MRVPPWLTLSCAAMVILWGAYRIRMGMRSDEADAKAREKRGLVALPRRTHVLIGIVYLLLGAGLVAVTFGWNPLASMTGGDEKSTAPAGDADGSGQTVIELEQK